MAGELLTATPRGGGAWLALLRPLLLLFLVGCGGGGDDDDEVESEVFDATPDGGILTFINAIPDSPSLQITFIASWDGSGGVVDLEFGQLLSQSGVASGYDVLVTYERPNGELVELFEFSQDLGDTDIEITERDERILLLSGTLNEPYVQIIENTEYRYGLPLPEEDETLTVDPEVIFIHSVPGYGPLDFYLTEAPIALSTVAPIATLSFLEAALPVSYEPRDDYRLRVTPIGEPDRVLFDSGEFPLRSNVRNSLVALSYFGPGDNDITVRTTNSLFTAAELPSAIRVANLVADVAQFDLYFGDTAGTAVFPAVPFQTLTAYLELEADTVAMNVTPIGVDNEFVYQGTQSLGAGLTQTLYIAGLDEGVDDEQTITGTLVLDDLRPIASEIRVRVVQGSASTGVLDVFLLGPGQVTADQVADYPALVLGASSVAAFDPGSYDVVIRDISNDTEVFGPERVTLTADNLYTLLISESAGGGVPLDVRLLASPVDF